MEGTIFVNDALSYAINTYLSSKDKVNSEEYNSFYSNVIKALVFIYGELDIVNPYKTNKVSGMGGFDDNLKKYGLTDKELDDFKNNMLNYHQTEEENIKAICFKNIQKCLINMLFYKAKHIYVDDNEYNEFKNFLYYSQDENSTKLELFSKLIPNDEEVKNYYDSKLFSLKHNYVFTEYKDITLKPEAYQLAGYNIVEVMKMSEDDIENINNKVYHFFHIKNNDINKKSRLEGAISFYKKYGKFYTSGSGFVDSLLISSIIATVCMFLAIFVVNFLR